LSFSPGIQKTNRESADAAIMYLGAEKISASLILLTFQDAPGIPLHSAHNACMSSPHGNLLASYSIPNVDIALL